MKWKMRWTSWLDSSSIALHKNHQAPTASSLLSAALHGIYLYRLALMTFIAAATKMAAEEGPKPRINGSMLPKHTGQIVSVVAKYLGVG